MPVPAAKLPLGATNFEDLRRAGKIYVDKTDLIFDLACRSSPLFLSRPRRFGKSLLISTFESLFTHGTEYFKGLKLEHLWDEHEQGKTYKAIHLDFSALVYQNAAEFDRELGKVIRKFAQRNQLSLEYAEDDDLAPALLTLLVQSHPSELILLIDEYDYPLTHSLEDKVLFEEYRQYLQGFFGAVKSVCGSLRFFFMTGVGRFAKTSVFSQLNNLNDLTLNGDYATLLGYTDEEVHQYFGEYVKDAALKLQLTEEQLYAELKAHYDGYRMTVESEQTVYTPWSVLNFLSYAKRGFLNYWYESGGAYPTLIAQYIKSIKDTPWESLQKVKISRDQLGDFYDYFEVPPVEILYQAGYLTIREEYNSQYKVNELLLCPPNLEVISALSKLYLTKIRAQALTYLEERTAQTLQADLRQADYPLLIEHFNVILNSFSFDNKVAFAAEHNCRDFIALAFSTVGINIHKELYSAQGRADLTVELPDKRYVFEFKLARTESEEERLLKDALRQLTDKRYGEILPVKPLVKLAVVVSAEKKAVAKWQLGE